MSKTRIDLHVLLPDVTELNDQCIRRLIELLQSKAGIRDAHELIFKTDGNQLCIHFNPQEIQLGDVRVLAKRAGASVSQQFGHWMGFAAATHARRASAIEARLERVEGVVEVVVAPDGKIRVEFDRDKTNATAIADVASKWTIVEDALKTDARPGPVDHSSHQHDESAESSHEAGHDHAHSGIFGQRTELIFAILSGVFLLTGWILENVAGVARSVEITVLVLAYLFGGYFTVREAYEKIRSGKFEIDFLMLIAAAGAAALGKWVEGAFLLFLFSIGHALEGYAMGRAKRAIEALAELAPQTARVRRNANEFEVPVEELQIGDIVIVKPDERVAADGFVVAGESSIDQSPITGESVPIDKQPVADQSIAANDPEAVSEQSRVFAGTINQAGAIEIYVTRTAAENTLARVVKLVSEAETRISPTQKFTKKFERYFVPSVIALVILLLFAPLVLDEAFSESFYRAMAVLVAASPCALAIATPSAVLSGVARAARGGILIKGGGPLERLGKLDAIAFDKTGTLTEGKPRVTDVRPTAGTTESELLRIAVAVESLSKHPLAKAVVLDGSQRLQQANENVAIPVASNLKSITGRGIQADVDGNRVHIGKDDLFAEVEGTRLPDDVRSMVEELESNGRTTMIVRQADRYLGVIGLMDTPRAAAKRTIAQLRALGIERMIMISGDNQNVANAVAREIGLDDARGDLMPDDKVTEIKKLNSVQGVAMVGDGVNDAPALASASVGIAMGAAGSDVALETADVALMADNLAHLPLAIGLSRATRRIIRQNLWMSLGMVAFLVPSTILGMNIGPAVALHEGSTVIVVANALRLLAYKASADAIS